MKTSFTVLVLALLATRAQAACVYPKAPVVPDGNTASKDEMVTAMKAFRAYNEQITEYTNCLKGEHDDQVTRIDGKLPADQQAAKKADLQKVLEQKNDAAVDEATTVTNRFNEQVRAFNNKRKG